jgi:signal peptidase I
MIDAFSGYANEFKDSLRKPRKFLVSLLNLGAMVFGQLMLWKLLVIACNTEFLASVVMSGSMEPGFHRGDIIFVTFTKDPIIAQDISLFKVEGKEIPIIHRALNIHDNTETGDTKYPSLAVLTKGDNNQLDDRGLYNRRQTFLAYKNFIGRAKFIIPNSGIIVIWLNDYPWFKYGFIAWLVFFALIGRD